MTCMDAKCGSARNRPQMRESRFHMLFYNYLNLNRQTSKKLRRQKRHHHQHTLCCVSILSLFDRRLLGPARLSPQLLELDEQFVGALSGARIFELRKAVHAHLSHELIELLLSDLRQLRRVVNVLRHHLRVQRHLPHSLLAHPLLQLRAARRHRLILRVLGSLLLRALTLFLDRRLFDARFGAPQLLELGHHFLHALHRRVILQLLGAQHTHLAIDLIELVIALNIADILLRANLALNENHQQIGRIARGLLQGLLEVSALLQRLVLSLRRVIERGRVLLILLALLFDRRRFDAARLPPRLLELGHLLLQAQLGLLILELLRALHTAAAPQLVPLLLSVRREVVHAQYALLRQNVEKVIIINVFLAHPRFQGVHGGGGCHGLQKGWTDV